MTNPSSRPGMGRIVLLWVLVAAAFLLAGPQSTQACEPYFRCGSEFYQYSDATFTELVGYRSWACNDCTYVSWGIQTDYVQWQPHFCCGWPSSTTGGEPETTCATSALPSGDQSFEALKLQ